MGNNQSVTLIGSNRIAPHFPQNYAELGFSEKPHFLHFMFESINSIINFLI